MHGDIVATALDATTDTGIQTGSYSESTEYGAPRVAATATTGYGWLGSKKRSGDSLGGLILMGVRLYDSASGRFLSTDPVKGGNANAYVYQADPVNKSDFTGISWWKSAAHWLTNSKWGKRINFACGFACGVAGAICGGAYTAAYGVQGRWGEAGMSAVGMVGGGFATKLAFRSIRLAKFGRFAARSGWARPRHWVNKARYYSSEAVGVAYGQGWGRLPGPRNSRRDRHYSRWA
jgi:RHS repeat-associated protein